MTTYLVELFKAGEYESTKVSFIVESIGVVSAHSAALDAMGDLQGRTASRRVQVSGKKAVAHIAEGARDLRK